MDVYICPSPIALYIEGKKMKKLSSRIEFN